ETVYGFGGGADHESVRNLVALKSRARGKPFLLLIAGVDMLTRLDLRMTHAASSLAARFWPGPLTLVLPGGDKRVPPELRGPEGGVAVRWTSHVSLARLIRAYGDPITSTSANRPGTPPADSAATILRDWWDAVARDSTGRDLLRDAPAGCTYLGTDGMNVIFVCTGNTCRSPLAEALARRAAQLRGVDATFASAGTGAALGSPATDGAILVGLERDVDLSRHRSRPLLPAAVG